MLFIDTDTATLNVSLISDRTMMDPWWNPDRLLAIMISPACDVSSTHTSMSSKAPKWHLGKPAGMFCVSTWGRRVEVHAFRGLLHYIFIPFKFVQGTFTLVS